MKMLIALCFSTAVVTADLQVVSVSDLTQETMNEIIQGELPDLAIEFPAQTVLPVGFFLKGNLVNLEVCEGNTLHVIQTFYARFVENELILSSNLVDWKPWLHFITGEASFSLSVHDGQPSIAFGADISPRS
jgi:hypothetical protein